ncbi:hypothetical protein COX24_02890 [bacterium (Candidatus Gribaldobacteria) CG23_combo_of_CG06-09_8_20_14_all_37_87_8]|uniref:PDZ domain-containing protein n=2 Tax=Candidatus Gribaldobacteria TaxID=2798536 RepID=A0A2G9ZEG4_9BACT|nr:MAG: hypothetical protein AUJ25_01635 [Parcubacteria group bacterium CG1_02_37_13]PIP31559.1 MAG: hypothetical protein COX24_02890 [bacterium (Candidatus Gribaldobacteria) CG23_combo_of_CG06-09_8_20_14_all_37_87_8]PIR90618.1 MAG: hypothetical protein COU05_00945 [bacterium (Candidatus Gribaldobacteria) CG10_big_fil_rev_8_21_14_0_10_37_21]
MQESNNIVKIVKKTLPAVVSITMSQKLDEPLGVLSSSKSKFKSLHFKQPKKMKLTGGTGFFVDKLGTILTNRHVVEDEKAGYSVVLQNGEKIKPEIIARDEINDIAVLKINKKNLAFLKLGDSSRLELGQTVVAIGNALGLFQNTVSTGVISGLSREIRAQSEVSQAQTSLRGLIQTDAAINPGNSGGPLLDLGGGVIGVNAAMVFGAENIGFALPINNAKRDLEELKKYGRIRKPFLGVRYLSITPEIKDELNLPVSTGALVIAEPDITQRNVRQAVIPNSPAHKAGIKETDIILEIEGHTIAPEKTVNDILQETEIGKTLNIKILRKGKEKKLKLILIEKA